MNSIHRLRPWLETKVEVLHMKALKAAKEPLPQSANNLRMLCFLKEFGREIDSAIKMTILMTMSATFVNVGEFKDRLTEYLAMAEAGEEIVVCRRNVPMVKLEPVGSKLKHVNRSTPGSMKGTVQIIGDLTEPFIPESEWEMLK